MYVALTRAMQLKDQFIDYIAPSLWDRIGQADNTQDVQASLVSSASKGMLDEAILELDFEPDCGTCQQEENELESEGTGWQRRRILATLINE